MASPRFGARGVVVDAVAVAVRDAWAVADVAQRPRVVQATLRRIAGDRLAAAVMPEALRILALQPEAPAGDVEPCAVALTMCARCREVKFREDRAVYRGRANLVYLRDAAWMERQFVQRRQTEAQVAAGLRCSVATVRLWRHRHDIQAPRELRPWMSADVLRRLAVKERKAPGEIAAELGCEPWTVRGWAHRLGVIAPDNKRDQGPRWAHFEEGWWRERVGAGLTQYAMAKAAGIAPHAVVYHLKRWGLLRTWLTAAQRARLRRPRYPQLYEPGWLRARFKGRGSYERIARQLGCSPTAVTHAAEKLGLLARGRGGRPSPWTCDRAWYEPHFAAGHTPAEMAAAAGCSPKSIMNYMGELGLLEEYHQRVERWNDERFRQVRQANVARQMGRDRARAERAHA